jgi:hypothetical protein
VWDYKRSQGTLVESPVPYEMVARSTSNICKVFENSHMLWMGRWIHFHACGLFKQLQMNKIMKYSTCFYMGISTKKIVEAKLVDIGSFHPHHPRSRQDWRFAQSSPTMDREFSCYFLDDCTVLECRAEQLRKLFVVAFRTMFPRPCGSG